MLVLTRRSGETLKIGDDVSITILRIKGNQVRIGVNAPREVVVRRDELAAQDVLPPEAEVAILTAPRARSNPR